MWRLSLGYPPCSFPEVWPERSTVLGSKRNLTRYRRGGSEESKQQHGTESFLATQALLLKNLLLSSPRWPVGPGVLNARWMRLRPGEEFCGLHPSPPKALRIHVLQVRVCFHLQGWGGMGSTRDPSSFVAGGPPAVLPTLTLSSRLPELATFSSLLGDQEGVPDGGQEQGQTRKNLVEPPTASAPPGNTQCLRSSFSSLLRQMRRIPAQL